MVLLEMITAAELPGVGASARECALQLIFDCAALASVFEADDEAKRSWQSRLESTIDPVEWQHAKAELYCSVDFFVQRTSLLFSPFKYSAKLET